LTIEERQADRNFIAHGTWGTLMPDGVPMALSLRPKSAPGEVVAESFTDKRMNEIIDDISVGIHALMAVTNHLIASRHRPAPPPHLVT
jgi:hypothetical protein